MKSSTSILHWIFCLIPTGLFAQSQPKNSPPPPTSLSSHSSPPSQTLEKAKDQLQQEAARIQIQGRALTPEEVSQLKAIEQVSEQLTKAIESLKVLKL